MCYLYFFCLRCYSLIFIFSLIRTLDYPDFLLRSQRVRIIEVRLYSFSEVNQTDSFSENPLLEIGVYYDTVELVPTEEEPAEYLEQLAFEEEEEQILLSFFFFSGEEGIGDWYVFVL